MLPGFQFLLGLGALIYGTVAGQCKKPPQDTQEERELFNIYCEIRHDRCTDVFAPKHWPKYIYVREYDRTPWKDLASFYGTSVTNLQIEYVEWACKQRGIPFDYDIFKRAYFRTAHLYYWEDEVQPKSIYNEQYNRKCWAEAEAKKKAEEEQIAKTKAERKKIDDEIRKKRLAVRAERLARERKESKK